MYRRYDLDLYTYEYINYSLPLEYNISIAIVKQFSHA